MGTPQKRKNYLIGSIYTFISQKPVFFLTLTLFIWFKFQNEGLAQQNKVDSLYKVLETSKEDSDKIKVFVKLADAIRPINSNHAIRQVFEGLKLSNKLKSEKLISFCLASLGSLYSQKSKYDSALIYFIKRYDIEIKGKNKSSLAQLCMSIVTHRQ